MFMLDGTRETASCLRGSNFLPPRRLTGAAEVRRAPAEGDAFDGRAAGRARLAFAGVDAVQALKGPGGTVRVDVVAQRAAAMADGAAEHRLDRSRQPLHRIGL